ncbi:ABC transporter ATP-binding protein [uncultured Parolsenella sp.]|uniref:ABC transporter ATP-binding protein n=1 Tax=uncultured Parolsenella sp. TaxID=2083008 RepID=UPI0025CECA08|nr:ABC transporter ATP-binding protein [uncultured Parolsenella sp.]
MSSSDKSQGKPSRTATLRRVLSFLAPHGLALVASLLLAAAVVVSTLLVPVLSGQAIDRVVGPGEVDFPGLAGVLRKLAAAVLATCMSQWLLTAVTNRVAYDVVFDMRERAFSKLQRLPLSYIDSHRHGDVVNRIVTDVDQFSCGLVMTFQQFFTGALTIALTLWFMFRLNAIVTVIVVCVTPLSILAAKLIAGRGYAYFHDQSTQRGELTSIAEEYVGGMPVVETFDAQQIALGRFTDADARLAQASFRAVFYSSLINPTTRFVNSLVYAGVGIFGALAAIDGTLTVGGLTAFLNYANQYTKPFNDISEVVTELQNSLACAARLFDLLDEEEEVPDAADAIELRDVRSEVRLEDVCFSYVPDRPLIQHFSLEARPGMRVAIVGPTGCGKTTLINLLMRFYDVDSGQILVDGHDVRDVTRASLRASYGMVLQETWVKCASVRDNIALGKPDATDEDVRRAAEDAFADDFIARLPHGYDTVLDGEEASISAGQRQLLCIARAMLACAPMLILDEATSNIDTRTEVKVQAAFERLMKGRTSFVVAHRLSTIRNADAIVAMRDGHVVELGTHDELLAKGGFYASLYRSQFES